MSDYDNNLRGALFKNDRKESDNSPDYKGSCEVDGVEYWISSWLKKDKNGKTYMSLSFTAKEAARNPPAREPVKQTRSQQREARGGFDDMGDREPF